MNSALYEGFVRHRRHAPVPHAFSYRLYMTWLDLAELPEVFRGRWLWSARRPALSWFRRADHLGDPSLPLDEAVRRLVAERTGVRPGGPIRLLTHLRTLGYVMNPVSFYYCYGPDGGALEAVVAEVSNTPWGERHCYVLDSRQSLGDERRLRWRFPKAFHVSPFMRMEQLYDWRFSPPGKRLSVHMENEEGGRRLFDATMVLSRRELSGGALASALVRHPWITAKVAGAIYWNAARLRLRGAPFFEHPRRRAAEGRGR